MKTLKEIYDEHGQCLIQSTTSGTVYKIIGELTNSGIAVEELRHEYFCDVYWFTADATIFEHYEPPKKKVKVWKWAYLREGFSRYEETTCFYPSKQDAHNAIGKPDLAGDLIKIPNSEIEVDE